MFLWRLQEHYRLIAPPVLLFSYATVYSVPVKKIDASTQTVKCSISAQKENNAKEERSVPPKKVVEKSVITITLRNLGGQTTSLETETDCPYNCIIE